MELVPPGVRNVSDIRDRCFWIIDCKTVVVGIVDEDRSTLTKK